MANKITVNRAPVLTLWAAIVAERLGHSREEALTLGRALAGLNAQSKGRRLGIYEEKTEEQKKEAEKKAKKETKPPATQTVTVLGRAIPVVKTPHGLRAATDGQAIDPDSVQTYLEQKFGDDYEAARAALEQLARSYSPRDLEARGFKLYEDFRPEVPEGKKGWGAKGQLDLDKIRSLAR